MLTPTPKLDWQGERRIPVSRPSAGVQTGCPAVVVVAGLAAAALPGEAAGGARQVLRLRLQVAVAVAWSENQRSMAWVKLASVSGKPGA